LSQRQRHLPGKLSNILCLQAFASACRAARPPRIRHCLAAPTTTETSPDLPPQPPKQDAGSHVPRDLRPVPHRIAVLRRSARRRPPRAFAERRRGARPRRTHFLRIRRRRAGARLRFSGVWVTGVRFRVQGVGLRVGGVGCRMQGPRSNGATKEARLQSATIVHLDSSLEENLDGHESDPALRSEP